MPKHVDKSYIQRIHKNIARSRLLRLIDPGFAEKMRKVLDEHKAKEEGK